MCANHGLCEISHHQIALGTCPWCNDVISTDDGRVSGPSDDRQRRLWIPGAVADGLKSEDASVRFVTNVGLRSGFQLDNAMLDMFAQFVTERDRERDRIVEKLLIHAGMQLSTPEAETIRQSCGEGTHREVSVRIVSIVCCSDDAIALATERLDAERRQNVLWIIANAPWAYILCTPFAKGWQHDAHEYSEAKGLWDRCSAPNLDNIAVLVNMASFFLQSDLERTYEILKRGLAMDPSDICLRRVLREYNEVRI